ncbi:hypothetical protein BDN72DRAFT_864636 [Pluteus cervinus]|uniref:Uncharacterized protein n=1 Tax=Pluteus cervinus TaxID=181527 RepID=A0ACD3A304_9AGAR|nr:hypothetical protein BDN72DRAFT_864636 [Pluteus cervinus]
MLNTVQAAYVLVIRTYAECWALYPNTPNVQSWLQLHDFVQAQIFVSLNAFPIRPEIPEVIQNAMEFRRSLNGRGPSHSSSGPGTCDAGGVHHFTTWSPRESFFAGESPQNSEPFSDIGSAEEVLQEIRLISSIDLQSIKVSIDQVRGHVVQQAAEMQDSFETWQASELFLHFIWVPFGPTHGRRLPYEPRWMVSNQNAPLKLSPHVFDPTRHSFLPAFALGRQWGTTPDGTRTDQKDANCKDVKATAQPSFKVLVETLGTGDVHTNRTARNKEDISEYQFRLSCGGQEQHDRHLEQLQTEFGFRVHVFQQIVRRNRVAFAAFQVEWWKSWDRMVSLRAYGLERGKSDKTSTSSCHSRNQGTLVVVPEVLLRWTPLLVIVVTANTMATKAPDPGVLGPFGVTVQFGLRVDRVYVSGGVDPLTYVAGITGGLYS